MSSSFQTHGLSGIFQRRIYEIAEIQATFSSLFVGRKRRYKQWTGYSYLKGIYRQDQACRSASSCQFSSPNSVWVRHMYHEILIGKSRDAHACGPGPGIYKLHAVESRGLFSASHRRSVRRPAQDANASSGSVRSTLELTVRFEWPLCLFLSTMGTCVLLAICVYRAPAYHVLSILLRTKIVEASWP